DLHFSPCEQNVRMVALLFGDFAYSVHKLQRLLEIREGKRAHNVMLIHRLPMRSVLEDSLQFSPLHWRDTAFAGNTSLVSQVGHDSTSAASVPQFCDFSKSNRAEPNCEFELPRCNFRFGRINHALTPREAG